MNYELDYSLINGFCSVNELLETVRSIRQQISRPVYYPLNSIILYINSFEIQDFFDIISNQLNIKNIEIKNIDLLIKSYKPNKTILGKVFKKNATKYTQLIENGNITWDGCISEYYTFEYIVNPINHMIGAKFYYYDSLNKLTQAIVYVDTTTTNENDIDAEINNIRRQINAFRKDMGLKLFNKVQIIFEQNEYWTNIHSTFINKLNNKLATDIQFLEHLDDFKLIETFNGKQIKVYIKVI
jgi:hypothetical protein